MPAPELAASSSLSLLLLLLACLLRSLSLALPLSDAAAAAAAAAARFFLALAVSCGELLITRRRFLAFWACALVLFFCGVDGSLHSIAGGSGSDLRASYRCFTALRLLLWT